jgi:Tol biopolymer transport system component/DNA-binding winged helix-turn-helix (wHTH) protein
MADKKSLSPTNSSKSLQTPMLEPGQTIYSFNGFELDVRRRLLFRNGQPVQISSKAFEVLLALLENHDRELSKDELMERVWRYQIVEDANLTVAISQLRKALGEKANENRYIVTIPGRGYRFVGELETGDGLIVAQHTVSEIVIEDEIEPERSSIIAPLPANANAGLQARLNASAANAELALPAAVSTRKKIPGPMILLFGIGMICLVLATILGLWFYNSRRNRLARTASPAFSQINTRQLTTNGKVSWALISPNGSFYVYTQPEKGDSKYSLWLGQINGRNDVQLRPPEEIFFSGMAFSSDSKTLYYATSPRRNTPSTLYRIPVLGGVPEQILSRVGRFYSLSPDDKQIAFFRADDVSSALVIANLDGSGERTVITRPAADQFSTNAPSWSPDGSLLAVAAVTEHQQEEFFIVQVGDGQMRRLTSFNWRDIVNLVWQRDGGGLIAVAKESGAVWNQLWQISYPTGEVRRISRDVDTYGSALSLSTDSNLLLALQERVLSNIWVAPADRAQQARQITFGSIGAVYGWNGMDWTPEGRIIFTGAKDSGRVIYSARADGSELKQITPAGFIDERPCVTADGRFIVFQSNRGGDGEIWRANSDGTDLRQLTHGGRNTVPHVSPDAQWVVYGSVRENKSAVWRVPLAGGEPVRLTDRESAYPRISPDGRVLACTYLDGNDSRPQIALIPIEGGAPLKLFDVARSASFWDGIRWTPDGQAICYLDWTGRIWKQKISGGEPSLLEAFREDELKSYSWSADGKQFAFAAGTANRDAVLISNRH